MKPLALIPLVLVLASCSTSEPATSAVEVGQKCAAFGFVSGSPEMANCQMQMTMMAEQERAMRRERIRQAGQEASQAFGNAVQQANQPIPASTYVMPRMATQQVTCTSRQSLSGAVQTVCN